MLLSQHAIVGAVIGVATGNPILGFLAGYTSHHVLDRLPHVDINILHFYKSNSKYEMVMKITDASLALILLIVVGLHTKAWMLVFVGAFGASLPDLLEFTPFFGDWFRQTEFGKIFHKYHCGFLHWHIKKDFNWSKGIVIIVLQLIITLGGVWYLLRNC